MLSEIARSLTGFPVLALVLAATSKAQSNLWTDWSVPSPLPSSVSADDFEFDAVGRVALRAYYGNPYQAHDFHVGLLDADGHAVWTYHYQPPGFFNENVTEVAVAPDGSVLAAGFTRLFQLWPESLVLVKLCAQGSHLWTRTYPEEWQGLPAALDIDPIGNIIVVSESGRVRKLDPSGQLLWEVVLPASLDARLLLRDDGSMLVQLWHWRQNGRVVSLDALGNTLWTTELTENMVAFGLGVGPGGEVIAAGFKWGGGDLEVHRLESDGSLSWSITYVDDTYDFTPREAHFRPSGDVVVVGELRQGVSLSTGWRMVELSAADGQVVWETTYAESPGSNGVSSSLLDTAGNLYVSGVVDTGLADVRTLQLRTDGSIEWVEPISVRRMRLDPHGAIVGLSSPGIVRLLPRVGTGFCAAVDNSTGAPGQLTGHGSDALSENGLLLVASQLPANRVGMTIVSTQTTSLPMYAGVGTLCLAPSGVGRYQPGFSSPAGLWLQEVDLLALPAPQGFTAAMIGETWSFQHWHRDQPSTNFTTATRILVR